MQGALTTQVLKIEESEELEELEELEDEARVRLQGALTTHVLSAGQDASWLFTCDKPMALPPCAPGITLPLASAILVTPPLRLESRPRAPRPAMCSSCIRILSCSS